MSHVQCMSCSESWDAATKPVCSACLLAGLLADPDLLREKHNPNNLPDPYPTFRSVMSFEFVKDPKAFLGDACASGLWRINQEAKHAGKPFLFNAGPFRNFAGSGIPAFEPMPTAGLDGFVIADPLRDAHVYAEDPKHVASKESQGTYIPVPPCVKAPCRNLAYPGEALCVVHRVPPLAVETPDGC